MNRPKKKRLISDNEGVLPVKETHFRNIRKLPMLARPTRYIAPAAILFTNFFFGSAAQAQINAYLSAPNKVGIQTFTNVRLATETFSGTAGKYTTDYSSATPSANGTNNTTVGNGGTYALSTQSAFQIVPDDQYGAGTGNYMSFGAQSGTGGSISVSFGRKLSYLGFSWDAGDASNGVSFYNGTTFVGRYSTSNTISALSGTTVTAINGTTTYQTSQYRGKPTGTSTAPSQNTGEPYGYLNFFASNTGSMFDRIVFDNGNSAATGFETDNHTVVAANSANQPTAQGDFVSVGASTNTPEPGSFGLLIPVIAGGGLYFRKLRRKNKSESTMTECIIEA